MNKHIKNVFKLLLLIVISINFLHVTVCFSQSIRKDYREMTDDEKEVYVDALWELWNDGEITDFENIHVNNFTLLHRNEMFLPWHREYMKRYEEEIQAKNGKLSIPYWDWTDDQSTTPEWNENDFLGQFNPSVQAGGWELNRSLGGSLPSTSEVNTVLSVSAFSSGGTSGNGFGGGIGDFNNPSQGDLEDIHNDPHNFVGGIMVGASSPRDPIFFFHHSYVDKVWQDWTGTSSFSSNSMPAPYSGINPHDIVDSRTLKVWYAEDGEVLLDQYDTDGNEEYYYTGIINAEDDFIIKNGSNVTFTAGEEIVLGAGFEAEKGSEFYASVEGDVGSISTQQSEKPVVEEATIEEDGTEKPAEYRLSQNYPNPFNPTTQITFSLPEQNHVRIEVYDVTGRKVATLMDASLEAGEHDVTFDASGLSSGIYIYRLQAGNSFMESKQMTVVK